MILKAFVSTQGKKSVKNHEIVIWNLKIPTKKNFSAKRGWLAHNFFAKRHVLNIETTFPSGVQCTIEPIMNILENFYSKPMYSAPLILPLSQN